MRTTTLLSTLLAATGFALAGCGTAQPASGGGGGGGGGACTGCHGTGNRPANMGGTDPDQAAAPPAPPPGQPTTVVGAHLAHVNPPASGSLRGPLACNQCHYPVPQDASHATQQPPPVVVVFGPSSLAYGPSVTTDGWNPHASKVAWNGPATPTCSSVYCHGSFEFFGDGQNGANVVGNLTNAPDWTGSNQAECGSCHTLPPAGHIQNAFIGAAPASPKTCNGCHPSTVAPDGSIVVDVAAGASTHINGEINEGAHPDPNWPQPTVHGYAAVQESTGLQYCTQCHTAFGSPVGDSSSSCNACHGAALTGAKTPNWQQNCVFCHGDHSLLTSWARPATSTDPLWAQVAPPMGPLGESATSTLAVGAHQQHVGAANTLSLPIACWQCHPTFPTSDGMPGDVGHVNGQPASVPLQGALATNKGAVQGKWTEPTCSSTYCHGNFPPTDQGTGGNNASPKWNQVDGTYASCTSCHGTVKTLTNVLTPAPDDGQHSLHIALGKTCSDCHSGYSWSPTTTPTVNLTLHVNGIRDAGGPGTSITTWVPSTLSCTASAVSCHNATDIRTW